MQVIIQLQFDGILKILEQNFVVFVFVVVVAKFITANANVLSSANQVICLYAQQRKHENVVYLDILLRLLLFGINIISQRWSTVAPFTNMV